MNNINTNSSPGQELEEVIKTKLEAIGNLSGKKVAWIKSDLSISKSNVITRLFWTLVAKHFNWMRSCFYGINLNQSSALLEEIGQQVKESKDQEIKTLYIKAICRFSEIAPKHSANLFKNCSLESLGINSLQEALNFVEEHGEKLNSLELHEFRYMEDSDLEKFIHHCPNLEHLRMESYSTTDESLEKIQVLTNLKELSLIDCDQITDEGLTYLQGLTNIEKLDLSGNQNITDMGLEKLHTLINLHDIYLGGCPLITEDGFISLRFAMIREINERGIADQYGEYFHLVDHWYSNE